MCSTHSLMEIFVLIHLVEKHQKQESIYISNMMFLFYFVDKVKLQRSVIDEQKHNQASVCFVLCDYGKSVSFFGEVNFVTATAISKRCHSIFKMLTLLQLGAI